MPRIGNVEVSDDVVNSLSRATAAQAAPTARPTLGAIIGAQAESTYGQLRYGLPYQAAKLRGTLTAEDEAGYQKGLAAAQEAGDSASPAGVSDLTSGKVGIGRFIAENLASSLPQIAGTVAGGIGGAALGGPVGGFAGAIAANVPIFSASNVARDVQEHGSLSEGGAFRSAVASIPQAASDVLVERFLPGAGHVIGDLAATQGGGFLTRTAMSVLKAGGTEAVTEAAQQLGERYSAGLNVGDADAAGEYVNAAVTAFAVGGALGAGGGFRRTNAIAKPADAVTTDDMVEHVKGILDGSLRALPAPEQFGRSSQGTLALPSPEQFGRSAQGPEVSTDPQINMPNPTDFVVDPAGRVAPANPEGARALAIDQNLPQPSAPPGPTDAELLARINPPVEGTAPFDGTFTPPTTDTSVAALTGLQPPAAVAPAVPDVARPFQGVDAGDLNKARKAKNADPNIVTAIDAELEARKAEDPFHGVPMNQDIVKLRDAAPEDQISGVRKLLEDGDSRAGTLKLAERLGIDLNAPEASTDPVETRVESPAVTEPTAPAITTPEAVVAPNLAATPEAVPPPVPVAPPAVAPTASEASPTLAPQSAADPEFATKWAELRKAAGIQRDRSLAPQLVEAPANIEQARANVFQALATDQVGRGNEPTQTEKMARKMGLITDDDAMDITPLGRQTFLATPEGLQETASAAQQQGYTGAQASIFDRGVQAQLAGTEAAPTFTNFDDMAAYKAGQIWSKDFVENAQTRTGAQTDAIRTRQAARGTTIDRPEAKRELTPGEVRTRAVRSLIDAADTSQIPDTEVVELRRMAAAGATPDDVARAIQKLQGGESIRTVAPRPTERPLVGGRGQPIFKEMNTPDAAPGRDTNRAETEGAVKSYDVRNLIEFVKAEGAITETRAQKLHDMLDEGKVDQVKNSLKAFDPDTKSKPRAARLPTPPENANERKPGELSTGPADAKFEAAIDGKDLDGVFEHMITDAPSKYHRELMKQVKAAADKLRKAGVDVSVQIVRPGDVGPPVLNRPDVRAFTVSTLHPPAATVYLKGSEMGSTSGMNYQLAAHELLHAVTTRLISYGRQVPDTKLGKDVKDLHDLGRSILSHFNQRAADGTLSDFEKAYFNRQNNALSNADEILAWGMTNPDMQRYLQSIEYKPRQSVFSKMVDMIRNLLGLDGKYNTALTELIRVSEQIMKAGTNDLTSSYAMNNEDGFHKEVIEAPAAEAAPRTPVGSEGVVQDTIAKATAAFDKAAAANFVSTSKDSVRKFGLGIFSRNHIDNLYGQMIPGVLDNTKAHESRQAVRNIMQLVGENVVQAIDKLKQAGDKQSANDHARINNLMKASQYGIDGAETWEQHKTLHDEPNAANLKDIWEQAHHDYGTLARHGNVGLFEEARAANAAQNFGHMLGQLYERVANDEQYRNGVAGSEISPADSIIDAKGITTAEGMRVYLANELNTRVAAAKTYLAGQSQSVAALAPKDRIAVSNRNASLGALLAKIAKNREQMAKLPYFHLGRFGDHFAAFTIAKDEKTGNVDKAALVRVAAELKNLGVDGVQITTDNSNPRVMIRTDNKSTAELMGQLGHKLEEQGLVERDTTRYGPRSRDDNYGLGGRVPDYIAQALERADTDPAFQPDASMTPQERAALQSQLQAAKRALVDGWLDMQPDNSISKVLAKRKNVQGASDDMIRGFAHRQNVGAVGIAALMTRPKFTEALRSMRGTVEESHDASNKLDPYITSQVVSEIRRRDANTPVNEVADSFDKVRAIANTSYLGLNPSSALINMTALGTTVLPELAKKNGYVKSFHALRRAGVQAASVLSAAFADAQSRGPGHRADLSLTEGVLAKANIPTDVREFLRKRIAAGDIDLATMARALGQVASGKSDTSLDRALRYGSAFNLYSEAFARLSAAIAARDLHGSGNTDESHAYARSVVKESLMSFSPGDTARHLGKNGLLGPVTPLVTQFMQWNAQVTEKLFREFRDSTGRQRDGETAEAAADRRRGSQKFLAGHLAVMTTLAGTLGLPFASVFASALEGLVGSDDEPFDATAAYRNFLASIFGKDVGEVLARGAPRALGFDISRRAGEQDLLPFSDIVSNKGTWTEAVQQSTGRGIGAAPNMILSVLDGGSQIAHGNVLAGMKSILPVALKNPLEAYRMSTEGYVDTKGNKLPLSPGAAQILWQLVGFSPADKAEYGESRGDQSSRNKQLVTRAGTLRSGIIRSLRSGDQDGARSLINDAISFDQANPTFAVLPSIGSSMQRQAQAEAVSRATKTPMGVQMKDVAGRRLTEYANF